MTHDLENYLVREIPDYGIRCALMSRSAVQGFNMKRAPYLTGILIDRIAEWEKTPEAIIERINYCAIHELVHRFIFQDGESFWWGELDVEAISFFMQEWILPGSTLQTWEKMAEINHNSLVFRLWSDELLIRFRNFPFINIEEV